MKLTRAEIDEAISYDPETGLAYWKFRPSASLRFNNKHAGKLVSGKPQPNGNGNTYLRIGINNKHTFLHRVVWVLCNGSIPDGMCIDHIDGDGTNNRLNNLRLVSYRQNSRNQKLRVDSQSGVPGVTWDLARQTWRVSIRENGRAITLGRFANQADAIQCRIAYNQANGYHRNHGRLVA
jgi:hypothetical protein